LDFVFCVVVVVVVVGVVVEELHSSQTLSWT